MGAEGVFWSCDVAELHVGLMEGSHKRLTSHLQCGGIKQVCPLQGCSWAHWVMLSAPRGAVVCPKLGGGTFLQALACKLRCVRQLGTLCFVSIFDLYFTLFKDGFFPLNKHLRHHIGLPRGFSPDYHHACAQGSCLPDVHSGR